MKEKLNLVLASICLMAGLLASGCSGGTNTDAMESDVNGYFCRKCAAKFYTDQDVYAENCPKCRSMEIAEVMGFVCKTDGAVTLAPRGAEQTICSKCNKPVSDMKLPREPELTAWGATKEGKETVIGKGVQ